MNQKHISYIDPRYLGYAAEIGGLGVGLGSQLIGADHFNSLPETIGTIGGAALGAIPGVLGGTAIDRLVSPRNSNIGNALALLIAAGLPITGGLVGKSLFSEKKT